MDFKLTKKQEELKKEFDAFFKKEMKNAPSSFEKGAMHEIYGSEESYDFHRYMAIKLGEKGWLSRAWPKEYGGCDAPLIEQIIFSESKESHHAPGIDFFGVGMFAPTLMIAANEEQKKRLLPPISKGKVMYCQGWSEPDAGSDLASLQTSAIKTDGNYIVNGQKVWTTGAHKADRMFLLARTDPESKRSKGLSVFYLKMDYPGIEVKPIKFMNGRHIYNEVFFKNVKIPECDRIGPENEGWRLTRETMNFERSGAGIYAGLRTVLDELIDYVKKTKRDGKYLSENPIIRQKIARLYAEIELGHSFSHKIGWLQEQGGMIMAASAASMSKVFGTEFGQKLGGYATEIMGMYGQLEKSKWAPLNGIMTDIYQSCMGRNIAAGSNEIQRNIIAWVGLGLPRFK